MVRIASELRAELAPARLGLNLVAGLVVGIVIVIVAISFAALIFSGELAPFLPRGIGLALFTATVIGATVALVSSLPGMVATNQDSPAAITALIAAAIAGALPAATAPEAVFATVVAGISLATLATGLFFLVLGYFRLGGLVRFIPYPVIGGFLAGTGWLLVRGSFGVMADASLTLENLGGLSQPESVVRWLPGVLFAVLLLFVLRRYEHFLILPAALIAAVGLFYAVLATTGTSVMEAEAEGWLLGPFPSGELWRPLGLTAWQQVSWSAIFGQVGSFAAIVVVGVVALLLNASGLELVVARDIDLDRELVGAGAANLLSSLGGGLVGFQTLSLSLLGHRMVSTSRLVGLVSAAVCATVLVLGSELLSFFPKAALGGLLLFLGLAFLAEWVYDAWFKLPRFDYLVVLVILVVIALIGFLESVALGIVIAVALFVVNYSQIDVVKHALSGANHRSNVDRPRSHRLLLQEKGDQILILKLQGFLFFGTANGLLQRIRDRAADRSMTALRFVELDFRLVSGIDSSAVLSFVKLKQMAAARGFRLVLAQLSPEIRQRLERGGFDLSEDGTLHTFPELDRGVEWSEDEILSTENVVLEEAPAPLAEQLAKTFPDEIDVGQLMRFLERLEVGPGHYLMRQGEVADELFFIESGQVTAQIEIEGGETIRLMTMGAGTVVGEMELYMRQARSASVVTELPSVVYRLSKGGLDGMENEPRVAAAFHKFICRLMAERLANTNRSLRALLQ